MNLPDEIVRLGFSAMIMQRQVSGIMDCWRGIVDHRNDPGVIKGYHGYIKGELADLNLMVQKTVKLMGMTMEELNEWSELVQKDKSATYLKENPDAIWI